MCRTGDSCSLFTFLLDWLEWIMESFLVCKGVKEVVGQDASETPDALSPSKHSLWVCSCESSMKPLPTWKTGVRACLASVKASRPAGEGRQKRSWAEWCLPSIVSNVYNIEKGGRACKHFKHMWLIPNRSDCSYKIIKSLAWTSNNLQIKNNLKILPYHHISVQYIGLQCTSNSQRQGTKLRQVSCQNQKGLNILHIQSRVWQQHLKQS